MELRQDRRHGIGEQYECMLGRNRRRFRWIWEYELNALEGKMYDTYE